MLGTQTMQSHAPKRLKDAAVIAGCGVLLGGCAVFRKDLSSPQPFPWTMEMGTAETVATPLPPEAAPMGHYFKAEVALTQGDYDVATKEYELAVAADPASPILHYRLATLYAPCQPPARGARRNSDAVVLEPDNVPARILLAGIFSASGQERIAQYESILQHDPNNQEAHLFLGALYGKQGEFGKAEEILEQLTRISPHSFLRVLLPRACPRRGAQLRSG